MRFAKAHGLGNDFLLVEGRELPTSELPGAVRRLCERHVGLGADGLVAWSASETGFGMRLFNADGGEAEFSGNGLRCLGAWLRHRGATEPELIVETAVGRRRVQPVPGRPSSLRAELGPPRLDSGAVPMRLDPPQDRVVGHELEIEGETLEVTALSMGNPHCAVFMREPPGDAELARLGSALERHRVFPERANVELVSVVSRDELRVRFWERGVGPTRSSGTGAASAAVAAALSGRAERTVRVVCDGGVLECEWDADGIVWQTGEVELLAEGDWLAG